MSRGKQVHPVSEAVIDSCNRATDVRLEILDKERVETKKRFLDAFLDYTSMKGVCQAIDVNPTTIATWCADDAEFKGIVDKLKQIRDIMREEDEEEFLHLCGTGQIKMGKESGLGMPNVVAAKMGLVARNSKRWSERINVDRTTTRTIKLITVHAGGQDEVTVIDSPEFKELPVGRDDNSD